MKVTGSSIQQMEPGKPRSKCRKWRLWLNVEGLDKRPSKYFVGKYMEARDELERYVIEYEEKPDEAGTFGAYAEKWQNWRIKSGELAPGTLTNDKRNIRALERSPLWGMELTQITPTDCRDALAWIKEHPIKVETLSNTTMNKIYQGLNNILVQAWEDGLIPNNPMAKISAPKPDTKEREALSPDEINDLLDRLDTLKLDGRVMAMYIIILAGLRRGEACALTPEDIHGNLLVVDKAVKERDGNVDTTKTPAGVRVVPMPKRLQDKVSEWLKMRPSNAETLCPNTIGGLLRPQYLYRWWHGDSKHIGMYEKLNYTYVTPHGLRHSNLSKVSRYMSIFDLKSYAGWASIDPAKVYIHDDLQSLKSSIDEAWS